MNYTEKENTKKTSWVLCVGIFLLYLLIYGIVNHLPLHRYTVGFILHEQNIPFLPWTYLIYVSLYIQALLILRVLPPQFLNKSLKAFFTILLISALCFILIPIEYPRYMFPTTNIIGTLLRKVDGTGNCFPSLHVSVAFLLAACYSMASIITLKKILMWLWTIAIIFSVLTTKQHYLIDVFGGILLALPFILYLKSHYSSKGLQPLR